MTVLIQRFDDENPVNTDAINANNQALVAAINALAGSNVLQMSAVVDDSDVYMPKTGGTFSGQVAMPSALVGGQPVLTRADVATTGLAGVVLKAVALADIATGVSNPPTQAEVLSIKTAHNQLLANLRAAGIQA